jgi:hypothetical protein
LVSLLLSVHVSPTEVLEVAVTLKFVGAGIPPAVAVGEGVEIGVPVGIGVSVDVAVAVGAGVVVAIGVEVGLAVGVGEPGVGVGPTIPVINGCG